MKTITRGRSSLTAQRQSIIFDEFLASRDLLMMWKHIEATNPGAKNAYHNTSHMYAVAQLGLDMLRVCPEYIDMDDTARYCSEIVVVTAGLWHDYGHTAGRLSDAENIEIAVDAFLAYTHAAVNAPASMGVSLVWDSFKQIVPDVAGVLRVTEFPFVRTPVTVEQRVIRDADLLYTFCNETSTILGGLYEELLPKLNGMKFVDFVKGQQAFHDNVVLFTPIGKAIHQKQAAAIIETQTVYADLLHRFDNKAVTE